MTAISRLTRAQSQPRRGLRREEAAAYIGVSPSMFDDMVKKGELPKPQKFRTASVWDMRLLDKHFDAPGDAGNENEWDTTA